MVLVLKNFFSGFFSSPLPVDNKELWRAFFGVSLGLAVTAVFSRWLLDGSVPVTWLVAPMGATAIIVFALPASPMAQPWAVLGGNTVCALAGVTCANVFADPALAATAGVGSALA